MTRIAKFIVSVVLVLPLCLMASCEIGLEDEDVTNGKTMFWSNFDGPPIDVFVDGTFQGTITSFSPEVPDCESKGSVTITLSVGSYDFYAVEQSSGTNQPRDLEGSLSVKANSCGTISLTL